MAVYTELKSHIEKQKFTSAQSSQGGPLTGSETCYKGRTRGFLDGEEKGKSQAEATVHAMVRGLLVNYR